MSTITVDSITKEYKIKQRSNIIASLFWPKYMYIPAVKGISFTIHQGESVALLGPNGAGKTTTMKMLSGLVYPSSGKITVLGFTPFERKKEFLMQIGLVMGNKTGLDWDLTAMQSFRLIKQIYHVSDSDYTKRIDELTQMLEVDKHLNTQVRKLSLGERMKMELIGAILHNPQVLFLDEPTIGLDIISKQKVRSFLRDIQKKYGVTLLLTSHDMDDVEKVCDRVIVVNKGVKVYDNAIDSLLKHYTNEKFVKCVFEDDIDKKNLEELATIIEYGKNSVTFKVEKEFLPSLLSLVTSHFKLADISILSVPLEEVIADIYTTHTI